jgi:hypothetical protein
MTTIINGSSPSITFSDSTTQSTAAALTSVNGLTSGAVNIPRGMQLFFTTTNWTAPAGVVRVKIWAVGGAQGGSNFPAGGTAGIVSLGVYAPGGQQNQNPVGIGGTWNKNIGDPSGETFRLYTGNYGCSGPTFYGQGLSNGGLVVGYATVVPGTTYSVTAGTAGVPGDTQPGFCWLEW